MSSTEFGPIKLLDYGAGYRLDVLTFERKVNYDFRFEGDRVVHVNKIIFD